MKHLFNALIIGIVLIFIITPSLAEELNGTVVNVSGLDITVKVDGELRPTIGDEMEISFMLPDGEPIPVGHWKVTEVIGNQVRASVKSNTGEPVVGHKAVIFSDNPVLPAKVQKVEPQNTYTDNRAGISNAVQQVIDHMRSANSGTKRNGAKIAYRKFLDSPEVIAVAAEELKKGYKINWNDKYHVDAMAWMCNILGASYDRKYVPLLKKVYKEKGSKKIRKFAKKNYKKLR